MVNAPVEVKVEGLQKTVRALENLGVSVEDLKDAFAALAQEGAAKAKGYAPVRTGTPRRVHPWKQGEKQGRRHRRSRPGALRGRDQLRLARTWDQGQFLYAARLRRRRQGRDPATRDGDHRRSTKAGPRMTTALEVVQNLVGLDEVAISKHFGADWSVLAQQHPSMFTRALVMVDKTHNGSTPQQAKAEAMAMTIRDLNEYFEPEPVEVDPDEPVTEAGKDS